MSEKKKAPELRKIYSFEDMPTVDRAGFDVFGTVYDFIDGGDMGGQVIADLSRLKELVPEIEAAIEATDDEDEQIRLALQMAHSMEKATQLIFVEEIPDEILKKMSLSQHNYVHESFSKASAASGKRLREAMAQTKAKPPA